MVPVQSLLRDPCLLGGIDSSSDLLLARSELQIWDLHAVQPERPVCPAHPAELGYQASHQHAPSRSLSLVPSFLAVHRGFHQKKAYGRLRCRLQNDSCHFFLLRRPVDLVAVKGKSEPTKAALPCACLSLERCTFWASTITNVLVPYS